MSQKIDIKNSSNKKLDLVTNWNNCLSSHCKFSIFDCGVWFPILREISKYLTVQNWTIKASSFLTVVEIQKKRSPQLCPFKISWPTFSKDNFSQLRKPSRRNSRNSQSLFAIMIVWNSGEPKERKTVRARGNLECTYIVRVHTLSFRVLP